MFGPAVYIYGGNHIFNEVGMLMSKRTKSETHKDLDVIIQDDVWVGGNTVILSSVTIGKGAIVAAGSVITKSIEPYSISGGVPAKKLKMHFTEEEISEHETMIYDSDN